MKKIIALALALIMVLALCACGEKAPEAAPAPEAALTGIFAGTGRGNKDNITVHVTLDNGTITDVAVVEHRDSPYISDVVLAQLPDRIVECQSVNVDVVAGATLTSTGILLAVRDALTNAGADLSAYEQAPAKVEPKPAPAEEVDILIVGAGGSGLSAALAAKYDDLNGVKSDRNVLVIEKQSFAGGSTALSGGILCIPGWPNTEATQELKDATFATNQSWSEAPLNRELLDNIVEIGADNWQKWTNLGLPNYYYSADKGYGRPYDLCLYEPVNRVYSGNGTGTALMAFFRAEVGRAGVEVRLNTKAEELIVENGAVVGVRVTGPETTYEIRAQKVILACGGFGANRDMMAELTPGLENTIPFLGGGSDGDGFVMAEAIDPVLVGNGLIMYMTPVADIREYDFHAPFGRLTFVPNYLAVNANGERFTNESLSCNYLAYHISKQPNSDAYAVIDSANTYAEMVVNNFDTIDAWKGDTLEELFAQMNVDAEKAVATVEEYNRAAAAGEADAFGVAPEKLRTVTEGPFYAFKLTNFTIGSFVSLKVSGNCEVINKAGIVVPNLYAVGEMCFGNVLNTVYRGSWSVGNALHTGVIAAEHAVDALAK